MLNQIATFKVAISFSGVASGETNESNGEENDSAVKLVAEDVDSTAENDIANEEK